ncbi:N-6 DNA methylase [Nocardia sp. NPDC050412]|uniref:N-6 DNA methylase n=1 Tax=Nocardia sp. NPDC050412 TaxID=3364320 RepID=UPI0037A29528
MFVDEFVSRARLADLADVRRPTITTWSTRHDDFPRPEPGSRHVRLSAAIKWLDRRPIPAKELKDGEPAGFTYGARVLARVSTSKTKQTEQKQVIPSEREDGRAVIDELVGPQAARIRGNGSHADYLEFLVCLIFLLHFETLDSIRDRMFYRPGSTGEFLETLERLTHELMLQRAIPAGLETAFRRVQPANIYDLERMVEICSTLGINSFRYLLDLLSHERSASGSEFFTPPRIAALAGALVVGPGAEPGSIYDPYVRGGELLAAAASRFAREAIPMATGEGPSVTDIGIAAFHLNMRGMTVDARKSSGTIWDYKDDHAPKARYVLTNPPFNARTEPGRRSGRHDWIFGEPPRKNDNYAWVQHTISSLGPAGRAVIVMPTTANASRDRQETGIRQQMIERGSVEAIIMLPAQLFPNTDISVSIWALKVPAETPQDILFVDATAMAEPQGGGRGRPRQNLNPTAPSLIPDIFHQRHTMTKGHSVPMESGGRAILTDIDTIRRLGYSLAPTDYLAASDSDSSDPEGVVEQFDALKQRIIATADHDARIAALRPIHRTRTRQDAVPLRELCSIKPGPSHSRLRTEHRSIDGTVPVVMPRHLRERRIEAADADRTTARVASKLEQFTLEADDILCIRSGAMDQPAIARTEQAGWLFGGNILRLRVLDRTAVEPDFLLAYLSLPEVQHWIGERTAASVIPTISVATLGELSVRLPPIAEQTQMGAVLQQFDQMIANHRKLIAVADETRSALAVRMLHRELDLR